MNISIIIAYMFDYMRICVLDGFPPPAFAEDKLTREGWR